MSKDPPVCRSASGRPKDRFATRAEAQKALNRAWYKAARGGQSSPFLPCRIYRCDRCRGFHQTSAAKGKPRRRR